MRVRAEVSLQLAACTGCRACELACAVRRVGVFAPHLSYVQVFANRSEPFATLKFAEACDSCADLPIPECVSHCAPMALTEQMVREIGASGEQAA